ncbi:MAG TPA: peptide deformylase [Methylomirabilota bacterium]|nr:peptide deformylase [Methylomirabilota bacterium]
MARAGGSAGDREGLSTPHGGAEGGGDVRVTIFGVMAILKVARLGHPVLREKAVAVPVGDIRSAGVQRLIDDMVETMREYSGAGLAANQVHRPVQIAVIEVDGNPRYPDAAGIPLTVVINPVVTPLAEEMEEGWEGCLSVPDMRGMVPRHTAVQLECYDREANRVSLVAKDFFARVIQHETDHLNGIVYLDRMRNLQTLSHIAEWNKHWLGVREQDD